MTGAVWFVVGAAVAVLVLEIISRCRKYDPPPTREIEAQILARWDANNELHAAEVEALDRLATAAEVWQARYTRRKKAEKEG